MSESMVFVLSAAFGCVVLTGIAFWAEYLESKKAELRKGDACACKGALEGSGSMA